jgi:WD40 repeat protein
LTVAVSPDGKSLATLNDNGVIRLWDMETGKEQLPAQASPCALEAVCFQADGKTLLTVGRDQAVRSWEAATGRLLGPPVARVKGFEPAFTADGKLLTTYFLKDDDSCVGQVYDAATGKLLAEQPGFSPIISPDAKLLAVWGQDKLVRIVDLKTAKLIQTLTPLGDKEVENFFGTMLRGFTPDGKSLVLQSDSVAVWDIATAQQKSSWSLLKNNLLQKPAPKDRHSWERIQAAALSPDGSQIAFALLKDKEKPMRGDVRDWFGRMVVLETATGKVLQQTDVVEEAFEHIVFSPDGKHLAAGGPWTVRVWRVGTEHAAWQFEGHRGRVRALAFSADGRRLASASEDSTVLVWDLAK